MYSRHWATYGNDNRQYIANTKIQSWHLLSGPPSFSETSTNDGDSKAGKSSTCKCTPCARYFMEWTSSTLCTCPQTATLGSEIWRFIHLEKSPAPTQWKDFCEKTPIDIARHSIILFWLLLRYRMFSRGTVQMSPKT